MLKLIAAAALLAAGVPVVASAQQVQHDIHVSYHDLDLHRPGDVRILDNRLRAAINAVCPDDRTTDPLVKLEVVYCHKAKHAEVAAARNAALARASASQIAAAH